ncbi:MAG: ABC transporter permease [Anaerolineaceae bacterium]|nr:ABC transporter permease [Anaerolineaceae bacterium]
MKLTLERRQGYGQWTLLLTILGAVLVALAFGALLLLIVGVNPIEAYRLMFVGAFGSEFATVDTLVKASPLLLTGLGVSLALRANIWNIGAEGQLVMGGFAAAGVALFWSEWLPEPLLLPAVILAGFVGGALWGLIPALLKIFGGVNEIVSTLMLNYVAVLWVEYLFFDAWRDPRGFGFPGTAEFPRAAWLPRLTGQLHIGIIFGLIIAALIWFLLNRTTIGYEIRVQGKSPLSARYAGINVMRNLMLVMFLSGGIAGLAGMGEVAGISHRMQNGLAVGYGFTALIVAFLGRLSPPGVIVAAVFVAGLSVGSEQLQLSMNLPASFALILQGAVLLCIAAGDLFLRYRVRLNVRPPSQQMVAE